MLPLSFNHVSQLQLIKKEKKEFNLDWFLEL